MQKIKTLLLVMTLFITVSKANAQSEKYPWSIGVGFDAIDLTQYGISDVGNQIVDYVGFDDLNAIPLLSRLYVTRHLHKGFTLDVAGSFNSITVTPDNDEAEKKPYYSLDLGARYDLNYLVGETGWFDPYVKLAGGSLWVDSDSAIVMSAGFGFNTWFNDVIGLNFETSYKSDIGDTPYIENYHFQHSLSFVVKFGNRDSDRDGVNDADDNCPKIAGKEELFGCPDADGDGIIDSEDACPGLAGPEETNGCPDTDGDGVADKDDVCPNLAGSAEDKGCPDSDKDGLTDNIDKCPKEFGPLDNNGCPWADTDGDGVTDNIDNCINEKGSKSNKGCPVKLTEEAKATLGKYAKTIQFNSGKSTFKPGVTNTLDKVVEVMREFKDVKFDVEGHSDSSGNDDNNLKLSQERAQAVVDYLGSHGINSNRLHAVGYGETKPIATNKTAAGRAENRRVVLTAK